MKPESCRNSTKNRKDRWVHSYQWYAVGDTSVTTREELMEMLILRCTKTNLGGTSCDPNMMSTEVEKRGSRWQKQARSWAVPAVPYKPRLHMAGRLRQDHPGIHTTSHSQPRSHHQELWSCTIVERRFLLLVGLLRLLWLQARYKNMKELTNHTVSRKY